MMWSYHRGLLVALTADPCSRKFEEVIRPRVGLLRIGVVLFAFGYGLSTDANIDRIIMDGTVVKSAEAGGYGGGGRAGVAGSGWGGSGGSAGRQPAGGSL